MCIIVEFYLHSLWRSSERASVWSPSTGLLLPAMAWYSFFLGADPAGGGGPKAGGGGGGGAGGGGGITETSADIFESSLLYIKWQMFNLYNTFLHVCERIYRWPWRIHFTNTVRLTQKVGTHRLLTPTFFSSETYEYEWTLGCLSNNVRCYWVISDMHTFSFCGVLFP